MNIKEAIEQSQKNNEIVRFGVADLDEAVTEVTLAWDGEVEYTYVHGYVDIWGSDGEVEFRLKLTIED